MFTVTDLSQRYLEHIPTLICFYNIYFFFCRNINPTRIYRHCIVLFSERPLHDLKRVIRTRMWSEAVGRSASQKQRQYLWRLIERFVWYTTCLPQIYKRIKYWYVYNTWGLFTFKVKVLAHLTQGIVWN